MYYIVQNTSPETVTSTRSTAELSIEGGYQCRLLLPKLLSTLTQNVIKVRIVGGPPCDKATYYL